MRATYHTHTQFCDGKASAEAMAEAAFRAGYQVLGFSSHAPIPIQTSWNMRADSLPGYCAEVRRLAAAWKGRGLEVLLGLEIDWIEGLRGPSDALFDGLDLDFRLCSVHFVKPGPGEAFTVDCPGPEFDAAVAEEAGGDGRPVYRSYYRALCRAIEAGGFDIIGHFDLVVRNNQGGRWFDEESPDYLAAAMEAVELAGESGAVVEVNLGPVTRGKAKLPHPSLAILRGLRERGAPITFCADAHDESQLGARLELARELAEAAGYRSVAVLTKGSWREVGIDET